MQTDIHVQTESYFIIVWPCYVLLNQSKTKVIRMTQLSKIAAQ